MSCFDVPAPARAWQDLAQRAVEDVERFSEQLQHEKQANEQLRAHMRSTACERGLARLPRAHASCRDFLEQRFSHCLSDLNRAATPADHRASLVPNKALGGWRCWRLPAVTAAAATAAAARLKMSSAGRAQEKALADREEDVRKQELLLLASASDRDRCVCVCVRALCSG